MVNQLTVEPPSAKKTVISLIISSARRWVVQLRSRFRPSRSSLMRPPHTPERGQSGPLYHEQQRPKKRSPQESPLFMESANGARETEWRTLHHDPIGHCLT
jgi:hypothetical protein